MNSDDGPSGEVAALRERISVLCAASLRIIASLDLDTVLHEVLHSARALTGARYAAIVTIDESGEPQDFVTSGLSEDEHRRLVEWSDGPRLFAHFRDLSGPLRLGDVPAYVRSLGFCPDLLPSRTFLGMPMHHRGVHVGNCYLVEKENGAAFSVEDEEVLVLLASHAATAIANARTYRAEQHARAHQEALIETSPVGVVVFDPGSGRPVSINREAARIVESLRLPGHPPEALLEVITCRRADGREIALDRLPLSAALSSAETVRAEEIVLSTPDGRSVRTLVNATPIHAPDGKLASVVVTMQDLSPLEELERTRNEFLSMVSYELRTPLTSIKGSAAVVLGAAREFGPAETREFFRIVDQQADLGRTAAHGRAFAGGPGAQFVPRRRRSAHRAYRSAARARAGDGGPRTHRAGAAQPVLQRRAAGAGVVSDQGRGRARRGTRRRRGSRRRQGHRTRTHGSSVPEVPGRGPRS